MKHIILTRTTILRLKECFPNYPWLTYMKSERLFCLNWESTNRYGILWMFEFVHVWIFECVYRLNIWMCVSFEYLNVCATFEDVNVCIFWVFEWDSTNECGVIWIFEFVYHLNIWIRVSFESWRGVPFEYLNVVLNWQVSFEYIYIYIYIYTNTQTYIHTYKHTYISTHNGMLAGINVIRTPIGRRKHGARILRTALWPK
jgi:hypothetical protein